MNIRKNLCTCEKESSLPWNHLITKVVMVIFNDSPPTPNKNLPKTITAILLEEAPMLKTNCPRAINKRNIMDIILFPKEYEKKG